jgi:hypothetical protein
MDDTNLAIIFNDGNLKFDDFKNECQNDSWVPLTVLREKETGQIYVPMFKNPETAHKFMCRNFNRRKVVTGILMLVAKDVQTMENNGWQIMWLSWPNKFANHKKFKLDVEIFELDEKPDMTGYEGKFTY